MADIKYTLPSPTEDVEQICLFRWANAQQGKYPELALMYHVPNGGKRSKSEAARFRAMGVKAGVPDIFLPVGIQKLDSVDRGQYTIIRTKYNGLYIELKRQRGGTPWKFAKAGKLPPLSSRTIWRGGIDRNISHEQQQETSQRQRLPPF